MRAGRRRRREPVACTRTSTCCSSQGQFASSNGPLRELRRRAATATCRARASARSCSSRCAGRSADGDHIYGVIRGTAHQPRRQDQRLHRAEPAGAGAASSSRRCEQAGVDARRGQLRRGARHRHGARRPDRDRRADPGLRRAHAGRRQFCAIGSVEVEHRALRERGRHRRPHQGAAADEARPSSCRRCTPKCSTRTSTSTAPPSTWPGSWHRGAPARAPTAPPRRGSPASPPSARAAPTRTSSWRSTFRRPAPRTALPLRAVPRPSSCPLGRTTPCGHRPSSCCAGRPGRAPRPSSRTSPTPSRQAGRPTRNASGSSRPRPVNSPGSSGRSWPASR